MNMRAMFRVEPEELLAMADGERYELIDGIPREKDMGAASDEIATMTSTVLNVFVRPRKLGKVYGAQTGYQCFPRAPKTTQNQLMISLEKRQLRHP